MELAQLSRERRLQPGEEIVRQGQTATNFFIVTEGAVVVHHTAPTGETRSLGTFSAGYHFGEIALLAREQRTATVRAVQRTEVLELPGQAFLRHLMGIPLARYRISRLAAQRKQELGRGAANGGHAKEPALTPVPDSAPAPR
jgi:CRP-like cAMP-binding protein